jgi:hypothetical protein
MRCCSRPCFQCMRLFSHAVQYSQKQNASHSLCTLQAPAGATRCTYTRTHSWSPIIIQEQSGFSHIHYTHRENVSTSGISCNTNKISKQKKNKKLTKLTKCPNLSPKKCSNSHSPLSNCLQCNVSLSTQENHTNTRTLYDSGPVNVNHTGKHETTQVYHSHR